MATGTVKCPACGLEEPVRDGGSTAIKEIGDFVCDGCGARAVHGRLMPRGVVEPARGELDALWVRCRFQDPKTKADVYVVDLDPKAAFSLAQNILSLVRL